MKGLQVVLLIGAGLLGGALVTSIWQPKTRRANSVPSVARVETPKAPVTEPSAPPAVEAPPPAAVQPSAPSPAVAPVPAHASAASDASAAPAAPARVERKPSPLPPPVRREAPLRVAHAAPPPANPRPLDLGAKVEPAPPAPVAHAEPAPVSAAETPAPAPSTPPVRTEPQPMTPAPLPAPEPNKVTLNAGMLIPVRLVDGLSSERNVAGDPFSATLYRELAADGFVIAERGARVEGRVVAVERGTSTKGPSILTVEISRIFLSDGQVLAVQSDRIEKRAESSRGSDAAKIGGGAIIGAVIGGIAGGGKGAAIGAGVGGGAGVGDVLLTRGKPATLASETVVNFRLRAPVTVTEKRAN